MKVVGKKILRNGCLLVGSIFFAVLLVEAGLRAANISYPVFHIFDYERGKALKPGKEGWWKSEGEAYVKINQTGFRDTEHSLNKANGTYRIAVLGDSYAEARQVALEDTFWKRLEGHLQSCHRLSYENVEVLNFGVSGYGTAEELLTLRYHGLAYEPDLILTIFFSGNDLQDNFPQRHPEWAGITRRPYFYFDREDLKLKTSFRDQTLNLLRYRFLLWGVHHSRTLELANQVMRVAEAQKIKRNPNYAFKETMLSEFVYAPPRTPMDREAWKVTEAILTLMHKEVVERGAKFLLVTATSPNQIDLEQRRLVKVRLGVDSLDYPERRLKTLGEAIGFPVLNLLYEFQQYAERNEVYLHGFSNTRLGAGHWNEDGHRVAAKLIAERICNDPSLY